MHSRDAAGPTIPRSGQSCGWSALQSARSGVFRKAMPRGERAVPSLAPGDARVHAHQARMQPLLRSTIRPARRISAASLRRIPPSATRRNHPRRIARPPRATGGRDKTLWSGLRSTPTRKQSRCSAARRGAECTCLPPPRSVSLDAEPAELETVAIQNPRARFSPGFAGPGSHHDVETNRTDRIHRL